MVLAVIKFTLLKLAKPNFYTMVLGKKGYRNGRPRSATLTTHLRIPTNDCML